MEPLLCKASVELLMAQPGCLGESHPALQPSVGVFESAAATYFLLFLNIPGRFVTAPF